MREFLGGLAGAAKCLDPVSENSLPTGGGSGCGRNDVSERTLHPHKIPGFEDSRAPQFQKS